MEGEEGGVHLELMLCDALVVSQHGPAHHARELSAWKVVARESAFDELRHRNPNPCTSPSAHRPSATAGAPHAHMNGTFDALETAPKSATAACAATSRFGDLPQAERRGKAGEKKAQWEKWVFSA